MFVCVCLCMHPCVCACVHAWVCTCVRACQCTLVCMVWCSEQRLEKFGRFVKSMDDSVKQLNTVCENNAKKHQGRTSFLVKLFTTVTFLELCLLHYHCCCCEYILFMFNWPNFPRLLQSKYNSCICSVFAAPYYYCLQCFDAVGWAAGRTSRV